jgi:glycosyltransferase involved in cell wall biosynthesis
MGSGARFSVTVVIPCFNYGRFVRTAVRSALEQESADVQVVVVDDGSDDGRSPADCDACRAERVEVIHQPNTGLPAARNRGARGATSEFLAFLDADDYLEPWFVRELAGAIRAEEAAGRGGDVSHAYGQQRMGELGRGQVWKVPDWDPLLLMITNLHPPTALVRRERFEAAAGFDESMRDGYEDWDFWLKMAERGWRGVRVRRPVYVWRRHCRETMIAEAVRKHEAIYRRIVENHRALYERRADEVVARTNLMLRRHDMNWLDESGEPIHLRGLLRQRARYEAMRSVRLHHKMHEMIERLPGPLATAARGALSLVKKMAGNGSVTAPDQPAKRGSVKKTAVEEPSRLGPVVTVPPPVGSSRVS